MAGKPKPLEVVRQVTPGKYPDGDGLCLIVAGSGRSVGLAITPPCPTPKHPNSCLG